jgi:hypothetical protein
MPGAYLESTRGSTEANRQLLGVKLQHGNSSAGGDMADYSTGQPACRPDVLHHGAGRRRWRTGRRVRSVAQSTPATTTCAAANRYIRAVASAFKNKVTTESSGDESFHVGAR